MVVTALKHLHSAAEPPDGENHETSLASPALPDANQLLLHPPGQGTVAGLATSGDEGSSVLYQFKVGQFTLTWHDTVGPLRERAPALLGLLRRLPRTDVELGSTLGFNDPTNGQRDPVDYVTAMRPQFFYPMHHDFIAEYGVSKGLEGVFRRELAKRAPVPTEIRWLYDPQDYLRPKLMTFDVEAARFADPGACLARRSPIGRAQHRPAGCRAHPPPAAAPGPGAAAADRALVAVVREGLARLGAGGVHPPRPRRAAGLHRGRPRQPGRAPGPARAAAAACSSPGPGSSASAAGGCASPASPPAASAGPRCCGATSGCRLLRRTARAFACR